MGANKSATIVPGHGTLFVADRDAEFPEDPLTAFTLTGSTPEGWTNVGHTSKGNQPAFSKEGGEPTVLDSWLADGVEVIYSAEQWALGINALQVDEDNLNLGFGGFFDTDGGYVVPTSNPGLEKQAFLLATDGTGSLGFWMEHVSTKLGDAPSIDASNFFELPLRASILAADTEKIPANENGTPGLMKIYKSGLAVPTPTITSLLNASGTTMASGAAGALVQIIGAGYIGVVAVKFGSTAAASYIVVSANKIIATVPSGSGSSPITVENGSGVSTGKAFSIS